MCGVEFNQKQFLDQMKVFDNIIIDVCPLTDKYEEKYNMIFITS